MNVRILLGLSLVGLGCGELTAEPIRATSLGITSVDIAELDSSDPYSCQVIRVEGNELEEPSPSLQESSLPSAHSPVNTGVVGAFVSVGELSYAGTCKNPAPGNLNQCWYTADVECEAEGRPCGGFYGTHDEAVDSIAISGGQYMSCAYPCVRDEDCPASTSGTALPTCMHGPDFDPARETGQCALGCGAGESCPDGFLCVQPGIWFGAADGSYTIAPRQCVQYHELTVSGNAGPR